MAYQTFLHSVTESELAAFRSAGSSSLWLSRSVVCSHSVAHQVAFAPLHSVLNEALDGGQLLRADLKHRLQEPRFHDAHAVAKLNRELERAWVAANREMSIEFNAWWADQIGQVRTIFEWAAARKEAVVCELGPPILFASH